MITAIDRPGPEDLILGRVPLNDITGRKFGRLSVIKYLGFSKSSWRSYWECLCSCGKMVAVRGQSMTRKDLPTKSCGCLSAEQASKRSWTGVGELSGNYFIHARNRARRSGMRFEVSIEELWSLYESQNGKCAISGVEIKFGRYRPGKRTFGDWPRLGTASLDRIRSCTGYIKDNVQWVHKEINRMKGSLSDAEFIDLCKKVAANHG